MDGAIKFLFQHRAINFLQLALGCLVLHSDYNAIRVKKIFDGRAFTQEFGVRSHTKSHAAFAAINGKGALQLLARLRGDRAFLDYQLWAARHRRHQSRDIVDRTEIRVSIGQRRRSDADEYRVAKLNGICEIFAEGQAALFARLGDHGIQTRLVDGQAAGFQRPQFGNVAIGADHFVPDFRETSARHQAHVARPNHRNLQ